jgi:hypothetical protein
MILAAIVLVALVFLAGFPRKTTEKPEAPATVSQSLEEDRARVEEVLDSGNQTRCAELAASGGTKMVDACYYNLAHRERNETKCALIVDQQMREYCAKRIRELKEK